MDIDQNLNERLLRDPTVEADVIICGQFHAGLLEQIQQAGVTIKDRTNADVGLIYCHLNYQALASIQKLAGIESVSPDDLQHALGDNAS